MKSWKKVSHRRVGKSIKKMSSTMDANLFKSKLDLEDGAFAVNHDETNCRRVV